MYSFHVSTDYFIALWHETVAIGNKFEQALHINEKVRGVKLKEIDTGKAILRFYSVYRIR